MLLMLQLFRKLFNFLILVTLHAQKSKQIAKVTKSNHSKYVKLDCINVLCLLILHNSRSHQKKKGSLDCPSTHIANMDADWRHASKYRTHIEKMVKTLQTVYPDAII